MINVSLANESHLYQSEKGYKDPLCGSNKTVAEKLVIVFCDC